MIDFELQDKNYAVAIQESQAILSSEIYKSYEARDQSRLQNILERAEASLLLAQNSVKQAESEKKIMTQNAVEEQAEMQESIIDI